MTLFVDQQRVGHVQFFHIDSSTSVMCNVLPSALGVGIWTKLVPHVINHNDLRAVITEGSPTGRIQGRMVCACYGNEHTNTK